MACDYGNENCVTSFIEVNQFVLEGFFMGNISGKNNKDEQHTTLDRDVYDALSKRFHTIVPRTDECAFKVGEWEIESGWVGI